MLLNRLLHSRLARAAAAAAFGLAVALTTSSVRAQDYYRDSRGNNYRSQTYREQYQGYNEPWVPAPYFESNPYFAGGSNNGNGMGYGWAYAHHPNNYTYWGYYDQGAPPFMTGNVWQYPYYGNYHYGAYPQWGTGYGSPDLEGWGWR